MAEKLGVVAGNRRECVGGIEPQEGMLTNRGRITRVTERGCVHVESGRRFNKPARFLTVRHSEARRFGYPHANGCCREREWSICRAGQLISA